jgi:hypothetical protein
MIYGFVARCAVIDARVLPASWQGGHERQRQAFLLRLVRFGGEEAVPSLQELFQSPTEWLDLLVVL